MKVTLKFKILLPLSIIAIGLGSCERTDRITNQDYGIIIEAFKNPDVDARPMARMWFTDAGAGASEEGLAMIAHHITKMAEGGFGGVEIAYLSDGSRYTNEQAREIGWGSENWKNVLKQVLKSANAVEEGFKVDITITAHWPPTINTIDPNDDEASKETAFAYRKITANDIAAGKIDVPLPVKKTLDYFSPMGGGENTRATFLFVDRYIAATIAKVAGFLSDGSPVYEFSSLQDVSARTRRKIASGAGIEIDGKLYAGYPAGVPDRAYCASNGIDYEKEIISKFGPEQNDADSQEKIDTDFNRKRMADWQFIYETDLSAVEGLDASESDKLEIGDYVIIGSYYRGTGQVVSGGGSVVMYNRCYATDYFSDAAVQKIFDYYKKYIFDDELLALLKENGAKNGTSIFEDSIEIHKEGAAWVYDFLDEFLNYHGYDAARYAPLLTMASALYYDDREEAERIIEDYNLVMGNLYSTEHAARISEWAKSFNYTYRAQGYPLPGLDVDAAAIALDIPEGDNSTVGDGVRQLASAVYMTGRKMLSMESTTFTANIFSEWVDVIRELNADFSQGVSRSILHGSAFSRNFNGYQSSWPGWNFFKTGLNGGGFSSWNHRQIYFDDVHTFSNYVSRIQAVLQNGQAKVDIAVLLDTKTGYSNQSGNSMQALLDVGYSYSILSEPVLQLEKAYVEEGILAPEGPSYKALIIKEASTMSASLAEKVLTYARQGLPVIFYKCDISRIYGTNTEENNDDALGTILTQLQSNENVASANTQEEVLQLLSQNGINPAASHQQAGLEITHRAAAEGNYYYLYNGKGVDFGGGRMPFMLGRRGEPVNDPDAPPVTSGEPLGGTGYGDDSGEASGFPGPPPGGPPEGGPGGGPGGPPGRGPATAIAETTQPDNSIHTTVTLAGTGVPFIMDAWTGDIIPVAEYTSADGRIRMDIDLDFRESILVCIASDENNFPTIDKHATEVSGGEVFFDNAQLVHRSYDKGDYIVKLNDGSEKSFTVETLPAPVSMTGGWDLVLESWGPSEEAAELSMQHPYGYDVDPSLSEKRTISLDDISLCTWDELPVKQEQLDSLGVNSMDIISGIGYYSTTFELPLEWTAEMGAYMEFLHHSDMIVEVSINGVLVEDINQFSNTIDAGNFFRAGANEIQVKLATTLQNRASTRGRTKYGLSGVLLVPYMETVL